LTQPPHQSSATLACCRNVRFYRGKLGMVRWRHVLFMLHDAI
jgi:hypothetical protein